MPSEEAPRPPLTRTARFAWGAVTVIFLAVIVLIVYALTNTTVTASVVHRTATSRAVLRSISDVSPSTFGGVGISAPGTALTPPTVLHGQPPLVAAGRKPEVLYIGAEFCPFCAAERWPLVLALSRFGKFHSLRDMQSSTTAIFPGIQTFSFVDANYTSPYVSFVGVEEYSAVTGANGAFTRIASLSPAQQAIVDRFGAGSAANRLSPTGTLPFVDIGNRLVATASGFSPALLVDLSQSTIVDQVDHPSTPIGRAILASANYLTAGICAVTDQQPSAVCTTSGVSAADRALGLP